MANHGRCAVAKQRTYGQRPPQADVQVLQRPPILSTAYGSDCQKNVRNLVIACLLFGLLAPVTAESEPDRPPAYPTTLDLAVPLEGEDFVAWAAPIGGRRYLTVRHCTRGRRLSIAGGQARALYRGPAERDDLAMLAGPRAMQVVPIAEALPGVGEEVYYRGRLMPGAVPTVIRAWWLGVDADGVAHLDGLSGPGCSGSPIVNAAGELVAVLSRGRSLLVPLEPDSPADWREALRRLDDRSHVRAVVLAIPVVGRDLRR